MYEKSHYIKVNKSCKYFKSKYVDIELVPEKEFFTDAPEDIKGSIISNDNAHNRLIELCVGMSLLLAHVATIGLCYAVLC
jgi:hypothetical protein